MCAKKARHDRESFDLIRTSEEAGDQLTAMIREFRHGGVGPRGSGGLVIILGNDSE